jgi:hypothetical protein
MVAMEILMYWFDFNFWRGVLKWIGVGSDFRKFKYIVIHHSMTPDQEKKDWDAIQEYHTKTLGWDYIGYHLGIEKINGQYEVVFGRGLNVIGAHSGVRYVSNKFNAEGIGICVVGNYDKNSPSSELYAITLFVCQILCWWFEIPPGNIIGHRDVYKLLDIPVQKSCPGKKFDIEKIRREI